MHTKTNETPVTTAEAVRLVDVVMADDPRELRDLGLMTVYKNPRTSVLFVEIETNSVIPACAGDDKFLYATTLVCPRDVGDSSNL